MEKTATLQTKLFGLPPPLTGAVIGIVIFLLILLPLKFLDYNSLILYFLALNLELPGRISILIFGMTAKIDMSQTLTNFLSVTISAIPAGILGTLVASPTRIARTRGIMFAVLYLVIMLACGTLSRFLGI